MRYLLFLLILVLLSGCTLVNNQEPIDQKVEGDQVAKVSPEDVSGNDMNGQKYIQYKNEKYGFTMKFPGEWQGFEVQERVLEWGDLGFGNSMDFGFTKEGQLESLFNISVHTKDAWKELAASEGPKPTFLGENDEYVLGWSLSQDASDEMMIARRGQASEIISSFEWLKK